MSRGWIVAIGAGFELRKFVAPEFVIGVDARLLAGRYAANLGARRALVVTGPNIIKAGWVGDVVAGLESEGIGHTLFSDVTPNPRDFEVMNGAELYEKSGCDSIIAIGGGARSTAQKGSGL